MLKIKAIMKTKNQNYIIDTNAMDFQNILIQCSLNQMKLIYMILDINLFYINYQQRQALDGYVSDIISQNYLPVAPFTNTV